MEESYILVLLTILILLVVIVGYFGQKKIREIELSTNALKCDFETHTEHVNNILLQQNNTIGDAMHGGNLSCEQINKDILEGNRELDLSKIQNIMNDDYTVLNEKNNEIYNNLNNNLKCIDDSDDESLVIENSTELLGQDSDDSDNDNLSSDSDEEILPEYNIINDEENNEENNNSDIVDKILEENIDDNDQKKENNNPKKRERKAPNDVASKYDNGHQSVSENDGKLYKVTEYKSGKKRWVLAK
tara:strand:- start:595 stop:1329 length:735 start_codon:yes stop_codon:yes gene_type:complete